MEKQSTVETTLRVENLRIHFASGGKVLKAVDDLTFDVGPGETLAVVGESGCGKSVTSMSMLGLVPKPPAKITGKVIFDGVDLLALPEKELRKIRGNMISMIFQEPATSLNPVLTVGRQIGEALRLHQGMSKAEASSRAQELLEMVGIAEPKRRLKAYPHQLSGGMRQRVMIAMALSGNPKLLIADEPTTALDVTIQAQILDLIREINRKLGTSVILITHDFGVVAEMADRIVVMYAGKKVEEANALDLFARPRHPYTIGLLNAVPKLGSSLGPDVDEPLAEIPGSVPDLRQEIVGCSFANRCSNVMDVCRGVGPAYEQVAEGHMVACHLAGQLEMQS